LPTAHRGCPKCYAVGKTINNRTVFLHHDFELRTNQEFRAQTDREFHKIVTELVKIEELNMIADIPIDYLHNCLLGIMRKLLELWFDKNKKKLYTAATKARISAKIAKFLETQPNDFQRKLRSLDRMKCWKGTELRTFALFIGPYVLKDELRKDHYENFLLFHIALTILVHEEFCIKFNDIAKKLINRFVSDVRDLYGEEVLTYNFHVFTHLPDDCLKSGAVDNFSAYSFESYIGKLKNLVKSPFNPLAQISNRIHEIFYTSSCRITRASGKRAYELKNFNNIASTYSTLIINERSFSNNGKDSYALTNDFTPIQTLHFMKKENGSIIAFCKKFTNVQNIYEFPFDSTDLKCFKLCVNKFELMTVNVNEIVQKMYSSPIDDDNNFYLYPMTVIE
jgi:hypothetical protein